MKLNFITIMVRNMKKTLDFYEGVMGMEIKRRFNTEAGEIVFMAHPGESTMLEFIEFPGYETVQTAGLVMSYAADSPLEEKQQQIIEAGYSPSEIIDNSQKPRYFTVSDPDGICVEIME
ncbi:MAG TPA: VOC family protein [Clostridiaceae bacterium]|nr:VOC family protein [Clostridiaceae bacterium]